MAALDRPRFDVEGERVERAGDVHAAGSVHVAVDGAVPFGDTQHLHAVELEMRVQPHVLEAAEQEAAADGSFPFGAVREGHVLEVEPFRIHGNRSGHVVGDLGELDAQDAVHDLHPFAADLQLVQGAVHLHLAVQGALEAVEDPGQQRRGIAHVQPCPAA